MKKVLVIAGPTAVGKSDFAVRLAEKFHLEIISGDSIQVYRGLDIGSGKIRKEEMRGIVHHLIDILPPTASYSAADFQSMARDIIDHSDKGVIICGGTGLYLKACLYDYSFNQEEDEPSCDPTLEQYTNQQLYEMLQQSDPIQAQKIHVNNRRRLLRSLTIQMRSGKPQSQLEKEQSHQMIYDTKIIGCTMERSALYERINRRVEMMYENGLKDEVDGLLKQGVTFEHQSMQGIGYKEVMDYFDGKTSLAETVEIIKQSSRRYAKRQLTWFRRDERIHYVSSENPFGEAKLLIDDFLEK